MGRNYRYLISYLNGPKCSFPQFYAARKTIEEQHLIPYLSNKKQVLWALCRKIEMEELQEIQEQSKLEKEQELRFHILRWMVVSSLTQWPKELDIEAFTFTLNQAIQILFLEYEDTSLLESVIELLFLENRCGLCVHDLCYVLYQSSDKNILLLVAKYLQAEQEEDRKLACKLLNFKAELQPVDIQLQQNNYATWYEENKDFLYFSQEHLQETSRPKYWKVNQESKYLCQDGGHILPEYECQDLESFRQLDKKQQKQLAKLSYALYQRDRQNWEEWFSKPLKTQLASIEKEGGASHA